MALGTSSREGYVKKSLARNLQSFRSAGILPASACQRGGDFKSRRFAGAAVSRQDAGATERRLADFHYMIYFAQNQKASMRKERCRY
jgi:hypothetical protein